MHITRSPRFGAQRSKRLFALELAATTAISVNWLPYIYLVVNGQALQTSIAYLTTPLLNVALGVGMFTAQSPTFPWMAIVLATSFSAYGLLKRYVPLDAAQATTFETEAVAPWLCFGSRSSRGSDCPRR